MSSTRISQWNQKHYVCLHATFYRAVVTTIYKYIAIHNMTYLCACVWYSRRPHFYSFIFILIQLFLSKHNRKNWATSATWNILLLQCTYRKWIVWNDWIHWSVSEKFLRTNTKTLWVSFSKFGLMHCANDNEMFEQEENKSHPHIYNLVSWMTLLIFLLQHHFMRVYVWVCVYDALSTAINLAAIYVVQFHVSTSTSKWMNLCGNKVNCLLCFSLLMQWMGLWVRIWFTVAIVSSLHVGVAVNTNELVALWIWTKTSSSPQIVFSRLFHIQSEAVKVIWRICDIHSTSQSQSQSL